MRLLCTAVPAADGIFVSYGHMAVCENGTLGAGLRPARRGSVALTPVEGHPSNSAGPVFNSDTMWQPQKQYQEQHWADCHSLPTRHFKARLASLSLYGPSILGDRDREGTKEEFSST